MAFRLVDGKIMSVDGKFPFRRVNTLVFEIYGEKFPEHRDGYPTSTPHMGISSEINQNIIIDWADGTSNSYLTDVFSLGTSNAHVFQDGNQGNRFITITFDDISKVNNFSLAWLKVIGSFPPSLNFAHNLTILMLSRLELSSFPNDYIYLPKLTNYILSNAVSPPLEKINDFVFNTEATAVDLDTSYNLSDIISSNLYKINQLKDTLKNLNLRRTMLNELPNSLEECQLIETLTIDFNNFFQIPPQILSLTNLKDMTIGYGSIQNTTMPAMTLPNLNRIAIRYSNLDLFDISIKWADLLSLSILRLFSDFIVSDSRFDEFINQFYTLITNEANITQDPNAFGSQYPYRFRNISWGDGSLSFTGTKQAPAGYVQGVSNGTPANEGEKVYVMQNQYGHVIDHAI